MTRFSASTTASATVDVDRDRVWAALTDPDLLPRLTPLLERIEADGDVWRWELQRIPVLTTAIAPRFTETMTFEEPSHIGFTHTPPPGVNERTGVEGGYELAEAGPGRTDLRIELTICADLPLPRASGFAVRQVMKAVVAQMGARFSHNLLRHLDAD